MIEQGIRDRAEGLIEFRRVAKAYRVWTSLLLNPTLVQPGGLLFDKRRARAHDTATSISLGISVTQSYSAY